MIRGELAKQLRRARLWVCLAVLAALPTIFAIASKVDPPRGNGQATLFRVVTHSGINVALVALGFMSPFFLVVVVMVFAGDSVSGEAGWGTLRYLLVRPVSRGRVLAAKATVVLVIAALATFTVTVTGLLVGTFAFGWRGAATVFGGEIGVTQSLARLFLANVYVVWSMAAVAAFAFLLSAATDSTPGAIGGAIMLAVAGQILGGISSLGVIRYGLPTFYWPAWTDLFMSPRSVSLADMARGTLLHTAYIAFFGALAVWRFRRRDILS